MSTKASRAKKPKISPKVEEKSQYATIEQLNDGLNSVKAFINQNFKDSGSTKQVNTLIGIYGAVTGSMNVMQRLPSLIEDQTRAIRSVASAIGTVAFILLATEVAIAIAAFAFIYLK